ncbi:IclR family transcriptional regulator [Halalkalibacter akibai]|uniref:Glycerol operon regulatory protein n=1 Tax=Halalkalibacter akibai (strain ATCC 43226 / DSM 21942 / CIP 109018 / JCM 9157 / 1139) TaxID=1236973 RepID=W4QW71_HALA3|nr:IclR family transcriptional regulator [Halalkalibacter akibai]GAE36356.1 transcriptional regulator [Halalkalibacter akibai JCM 9157]
MPIIQAVERALRIVDLFNEYETELKITDISERMQLHKSTVHSLLKTLQKHHYIEQNPENGKYRLGLKLFERGNFVIQSLDLRTLAKEHLVALSKQTGKTVHLCILDGKEGVYIDKVESASSMILYSKIGRRVPVHSSGVGKVLVAWKTEEELQAILEAYEYTKQTPYTVEDRESFLKELEKTRERGFAIDNQENEAGVICVAIPVRNFTGQVEAAISMSTTVSKVNEEELNQHVELLKQTAKELSLKWGYGVTS